MPGLTQDRVPSIVSQAVSQTSAVIRQQEQQQPSPARPSVLVATTGLARDPYRPLKDEFSAFLRNLGPERKENVADSDSTEVWANSLLFGVAQARGVHNHRL